MGLSRSQVSGLRSQVSGLRSQVSGLRSQVSGLRSQEIRIPIEWQVNNIVGALLIFLTPETYRLTPALPGRVRSAVVANLIGATVNAKDAAGRVGLIERQ